MEPDWGGGAETHVGAPGLGFISGSPTSTTWGSLTQISFPSRPSLGRGTVSLACCVGISGLGVAQALC